MIAIHLQGRLGNIMFQTAFLEYTAHRFGYQTFYPNIKEQIELLKGDKVYTAVPYADEYFKIFKNFDWHVNEDRTDNINHLIKEPYRFQWFPEVDDHTKFQGYFQSEEYWGGDRAFMQRLFEPSDMVKEQLRKYDGLFSFRCGAIHVRRGDYLKYPHIYPPLTVDYVERGKAFLKSHEIEKWLVFSDDIPWCKNNITGDNHVFIENEKDYVEMFLISKCRQRIIDKSSFSWWASYLSKVGGETIAPIVWNADPNVDDSHVCPWYWRRL